MTHVTQHAAYFSPQVTWTRRFYHSPLERPPGDSLQVEVVGGGCEWCAPDFRIEREHFPFVAMEFVWAGKGSVRLGTEEHALSAGSLFFFDPTVPHLIVSDPHQPMVKYFFNFTGPRVAALMAALQLRPGDVMRAGEPARLAELLDQAIDHALKGTPLSWRACSSALEHALVLSAETRRPGHSDPDPAYATYLRCRQYLLRHYPALPSVAATAQACHLSSAYLTRLFQRYDHETPLACLQRLKMNEALHKLRLPEAQAKTVAAGLGFKSAAHFSRAFKTFHGFTPREAWADAAGQSRKMEPLL